MNLQFAINYSREAADLLQAGRIQLDYFKCPAMPELVAEARKLRPTYVHFGLAAGKGIGTAQDYWTGQPPDWRQIEALIAQSDTRYINLHLAPNPSDYPELTGETSDPSHVNRLAEQAIRDVRDVVGRFGAGRVIVENEGAVAQFLRPAIMPAFIDRVVRETGCGLLLDVSHARLAARLLGMDAHEYLRGLPLAKMVEIHFTGIQRFDDGWIDVVRKAGLDEETIQLFGGKLMDHLPMTDADWDCLAWSMHQIRSGHWGNPWIIASEYGGVGWFFGATTNAEVLAEQTPRLYGMIKPEHPETNFPG